MRGLRPFLVGLVGALPLVASAGGVIVPAGMVQLTVQNNLGGSVCYLYLSPTESTTWGDDVLGVNTLMPGESDQYAIMIGNWDMKAEDCEHNEVARLTAVSVADHATIAIGEKTASTPRIVDLNVVNTSAKTVCYLYISPSTETEWGADVLESRVLSPGETDKYQVATGTWDFKAEDCDHTELLVMKGQTISDASVLTLGN
jgi:hypothetical protein